MAEVTVCWPVYWLDDGEHAGHTMFTDVKEVSMDSDSRQVILYRGDEGTTFVPLHAYYRIDVGRGL